MYIFYKSKAADFRGSGPLRVVLQWALKNRIEWESWFVDRENGDGEKDERDGEVVPEVQGKLQRFLEQCFLLPFSSFLLRLSSPR